jgi:CheY-like chemotaxis protein
MGIPICVRLAELMGGTLELESRTDGPGVLWRASGGFVTCALVVLPRVLHRRRRAWWGWSGTRATQGCMQHTLRCCTGTRFALLLPPPEGPHDDAVTKFHPSSSVGSARLPLDAARDATALLGGTTAAVAPAGVITIVSSAAAVIHTVIVAPHPHGDLARVAPGPRSGGGGGGGANAAVPFVRHSSDHHCALLCAIGGSTSDARARAPATPSHVPPHTVAGARVLIVDDSEANRRFAAFVVKKLGCTVLAVTDGDEVVAALRAADSAGEPIDVVLMDLVMVRARACGWAHVRVLNTHSRVGSYALPTAVLLPC